MPAQPRMSRTAVALASLAVLAATAVTACNPETADDARGDAAIPAVPTALSEQELKWSTCSAPSTAQGGGDRPEKLPDGTAWQCSTMKAPLDYTDPDGETIDLALIRAKASPDSGEKRLGSLVFNFGGPGGSGVLTLPLAAGDEYMTLHKRYDLVSFDPRGVGDSAGVHCLDTKAMDAWLTADATPDDATEEKARERGVRAFARACQSESGAVLEHVGTQEAARDLDLMRHVLGDEKLNYFGISYGTQLGGVYAHLFPKRVGRFVFDAVVDPTEDALNGALGQAKGFQGALRNFLEDCVRQDSCFFEGTNPQQGEKDIIVLLERLDTDPLPTEFGRPLTQSHALNGIAAALYDQESWLLLRGGLDAAMDGDGSALLLLSDLLNERIDDDGYANINAANTAVNCADYKDRFTLEDVHRHLPRFRTASSVFGDWMAWGLLQCTGWPADGHAPTVEVSADGANPVLVIGNTGDPATPYEGAKKMADELGGKVGVHLTVDGEGHGTYAVNDCLTELVDAYLLDGTVPANGTVCS
ncbi:MULTISPECIES: alpha/beta hydrolase [unclassified Streptomyces]|uniref:alpha/beta hydrolase n=1 Tax=unclassified Streptomyces TaxID=2593676 RepID=UPI0025B42EFB|nr:MULTISPECIES: alpha/beta hydrolase [unclassified Streptomyces]MDN3250399.1 alpha/beta hydrolase [Streptomyces sp. ZSW22]MDN3254365.1 alpha/beta hydrolase [Streptomyces sp. MA25(2023)]